MATVAGTAAFDVERLAALSQGGAPHGLGVRYLDDMESLGSRLMADWYTHSPQSLLPAASGHLIALRERL
jgi:hypothetical protein